MDDAGITRKLAVILAADLAGYARLMAADEEGTLAMLTTRRQVIDELIARQITSTSPTSYPCLAIGETRWLVHDRRQQNDPRKDCEGDVEHDGGGTGSLKPRHDGPPLVRGGPNVGRATNCAAVAGVQSGRSAVRDLTAAFRGGPGRRAFGARRSELGCAPVCEFGLKRREKRRSRALLRVRTRLLKTLGVVVKRRQRGVLHGGQLRNKTIVLILPVGLPSSFPYFRPARRRPHAAAYLAGQPARRFVAAGLPCRPSSRSNWTSWAFDDLPQL
jgi:hypothetical protein